MGMMFGRLRRTWRRGRNEVEQGPDRLRPGVVTQSEVNYFGLASLLIAGHGPDARAEAARLWREAIAEGDVDATADWFAVEQAVVLMTENGVATTH
jgi:hypothetical protein